MRGLCRVPRLTLNLTPTKNNNKNKKSLQNNSSGKRNASFKNNQRVSAGASVIRDEGVKALLKAINANKSKSTKVSSPMKSLQVSSSPVKLSKCGLKYAYAISDPFAPACTGVCVPSGQASASHKVTGFVRFDSKIGLGGVAFVCFAPSACNDAPQIYVSNSAYVGVDVALLSAANTFNTGVTAVALGNLPYSADDHVFRSGEDSQRVASRIASVGLSIQYTGTALNQSGMVYMYRDQGHGNVSLQPGTTDAMKVPILASSPTTAVCNFTRDRCLISDFAAQTTEMNFIRDAETGGDSIGYRTSLIYPFSGPESLLSLQGGGVSSFQRTTPGGRTYWQGSPTTIIMVTGQPGQDFHCEYVVHAEYIGNIASASYTQSDSDVQGAGMVLEAANNVMQRKTAAPDRSNWQLMYDGLAYAAKRAAPIVIPIAEKAIIAMLA